MLASYHGYILDLDGTIYKGNEAIAESVHFVHALAERRIPHVFLTNNSSRTPAEIAEKLKRMDVPASAGQVYTSSMAMAAYVREHWGVQRPPVRAYVIGSRGLVHALEEIGVVFTDEDPDAVIVGIDRSFTYEKLVKAQRALLNGAALLATNADRTIPSENGYMPGNGSIVAAIATAAHVTPTFIGKPERWIVEQSLSLLGTPKAETLLVGDNYDTDILAGINAGVPTLHVDTGVTPAAELTKKDHQPTHSLTNLDVKLLGL
ncbi:TIGR01457 family HAD-type hydrolase [Natribacillus halophilus]|uniref:Acid sugar phosphatase n=1 Tax=Natribacillus halophilus TaxID=549003 RepID=A0A1G8RNE3_9BACI|nr:TIGR01457 family HAD-type hydrolase [Natribacillus halophilus]SDJ18422.1 4-nitrophenyl phosphatase [Natribacillus halophilus]